MPLPLAGNVGPQTLSDGVQTGPFRQGKSGEMSASELHGRFHEINYRRGLFTAFATVTAPVLYTTAAGAGGPLIWNNTSLTNGINVVLLAVSVAQTTATSVAGALGITGNTGQSIIPTTTTVITARGSSFIGGTASQANPYAIGTPTNPGNFFLPVFQVGTGATTVATTTPAWVEIAGGIICPPQAWVSVAASATLTSGVFQVGLLWEEVAI